ncbi:DEAD/DEAH box helicase [Candidatus Aciduliprofundum boonei]|uniref:DEAD/DEAH box helicase domain protein n=1 Tax=Aciduliprofundum boonei (strain DSM 19572 / T469) TaxID=439481 RepID=B5ICF6_ACIB4|nr:DEAD/DEAH box helicase [Candidatus Aciduliprofundum boonei]ADD09031.1 DEAD/DEAH box helicase domain protein [Aciduliprofundum boonei T469]EDY36013.1 DEAD/H associated family [Aciduliprofundum boonei T469]HII54454.1 DEAD/DEAH box helicase [Candidatus Aciduliprofundum boonei]
MFETLHPSIQKVLEEKGIFEPTEPQREVIPYILEGKNVLLVSPTGSGKTEAAMLPIFHKLVDGNYGKIACIYITPLRALNRDLLKRLEDFGKKLGLRIAVRHGDTTAYERRQLSLHPPDVLITTPETFQIMFLGKRLKESLKSVKFVVIDEIHELASDERGAQLAVGLERLRKMTRFQVIGLSASVGNPEEIAKFLSPNESIEIVKVKLRKRIDVNIRAPQKKYEKEAQIMGSDVDYASTLMEMWEEINKARATLVFTNTRCTAEDIGMRYRLLFANPPIEVHHGSLSRKVRIEAEDKFKRGELKALICTSSLELGIDVGIVDFVIQFNSPRQVTKLLQRIGRAGHRIDEVSRGTIFAHTPVELWESASILSLLHEGRIESVKIREKPLMVLINQLVAMANSEGKMNAREAYEIIKNAYPFRNLSFEEFEDILNFMKDIGKVWYDGIAFGKTRGGREYFYQNISMIPDEKLYKVITLHGDFIGTLDESFVSTLNYGESFVMNGMAWRIVDIREDKVLVEYLRDIAMPPSWVGEEIPVPYQVASHEPDMKYLNSAAKKILENWKMDWNEGRIVIENGNGIVFIGVRGGSKANYTLALILSSILSQKIGESVEFSVSPYHIALFNPHVNAPYIKELLEKLRNVEGLVRLVAKNSRLFNYIFMHVAKKMGVIKKGADMKKVRIEKIVDAYKGTPLYKEVLNKMSFDYMDVEVVNLILEKIREGKTEIIVREMSDKSKILLEEHGDLVSPIIATRPIIEAVQKRLLEEDMILACLSCGKSIHIKVKDFKKPICPFCGSVRVTLLKPYEEDKLKILKKKKFTREEKKELDRMMAISHLLRVHKKAAALALAGRGIGLTTAARILQVPYENEFEIAKRVLKEELKYAQNKQFWDLR